MALDFSLLRADLLEKSASKGTADVEARPSFSYPHRGQIGVDGVWFMIRFATLCEDGCLPILVRVGL